MGAAGKRAGARRGPKKRSLPSRRVLVLCLAVTLCVVAWGYLVKAAIDFGTNARDGETQAWGFLGLACLGAAACLFTGLILVGKLLRAAGILAAPTAAPSTPATATPSPAGSAVNGVAQAASPAPAATEETTPLPVVPAGAESGRPPIRSVPAPRHGGGKRAAR